MSSDDDKQSDYRLMNVLCRTKAILLILANLQSNKRLKKETLFYKILYSIFLLHASL